MEFRKGPGGEFSHTRPQSLGTWILGRGDHPTALYFYKAEGRVGIIMSTCRWGIEAKRKPRRVTQQVTADNYPSLYFHSTSQTQQSSPSGKVSQNPEDRVLVLGPSHLPQLRSLTGPALAHVRGSGLEDLEVGQGPREQETYGGKNLLRE